MHIIKTNVKELKKKKKITIIKKNKNRNFSLN